MRLPAKRAKMSGGSAVPPAPADNDEDIRLRVESISGQVLHLRVPRTETVLGLKNRIFSKQGKYERQPQWLDC